MARHAAVCEGCPRLFRLPDLAEAGWDVWERLAALEPADPSRADATGQLEPCMAGMSAVQEQRARLQVPSDHPRTPLHPPCLGRISACL